MAPNRGLPQYPGARVFRHRLGSRVARCHEPVRRSLPRNSRVRLTAAACGSRAGDPRGRVSGETGCSITRVGAGNGGSGQGSIAEVIELADHGILDIACSRAAEQPPVLLRFGTARVGQRRGTRPHPWLAAPTTIRSRVECTVKFVPRPLAPELGKGTEHSRSG